MNYFLLTIKHKWFVFLAGIRTKAPLWRLLIHDWSKLTPSEYRHYQRQFFGDKNDPEGFITAWVHHQNSNAHHWEYWIPRTGHNHCEPPYPDGEPIPMPMKYVREMLADWMGAGRAYEGKWPNGDWAWFRKNMNKMQMHDSTWLRLQCVMTELDIHGPAEMIRTRNYK